MMKPILVCGHNPMTGPRHLGHYLSTMRDWPRLERDHELFIIIDDLIASILYPRGRKYTQDYTLQVAKEFIETGIDTDENHIVLTSMVPEVHELALWTSLNIDFHWCVKLYQESFAGLLSTYQRHELQLPHNPSVTEVIYPQIHLATMTLGLGADLFQGGEEMRGYIEIMNEMAKGLKNSCRLRAPTLLISQNGFVRGTDGLHMASENAIYVSASEEEICKAVASTPKDVLFEWFDALGKTRGELQDNNPNDIVKLLDGLILDEFKKFRVPDKKLNEVENIARILEKSAIIARERIKEVLIDVKSSVKMTGFAN